MLSFSQVAYAVIVAAVSAKHLATTDQSTQAIEPCDNLVPHGEGLKWKSRSLGYDCDALYLMYEDGDEVTARQNQQSKPTGKRSTRFVDTQSQVFAGNTGAKILRKDETHLTIKSWSAQPSKPRTYEKNEEIELQDLERIPADSHLVCESVPACSVRRTENEHQVCVCVCVCVCCDAMMTVV